MRGIYELRNGDSQSIKQKLKDRPLLSQSVIDGNKKWISKIWIVQREAKSYSVEHMKTLFSPETIFFFKY